jgi:hypothetical protein
MKIAVIGNSHTLAIDSALKHNALQEKINSISFDCYFIPRYWEIDSQTNLESKACVLKNTEKLSDQDNGIELTKYDHFIICSIGWWAARNITIESNPPTHPLGHLACADWLDSPGILPSARKISNQVMQITLDQWVRETPIMKLAKYVSSHFKQHRILIAPWPAPNRILKNDPDWFINKWYGEDGPRVWHEYFLIHHYVVQKIVEEFGPQVKLLDYPLPGPLADGFMAGEWCEQDPFHGNYLYGELLINQIDLAFK